MTPGGSLVIGQEQDSVGGGFSSSQAFIGSIDEIRVWNHSRTQAEIQTTMDTILDGDESGLVGYWNFNDGTATDLSGNGNHGTLQGGAQIPSTTNDGISLSAVDLTVQAPGGTSQTIPYTSGAQTINFSSLGITVNSSNVSDMTADLLVNAETFTVNPTLEVTTPASTVHENEYDFNSQTTITFPGSLGIDVDTSAVSYTHLRAHET